MNYKEQYWYDKLEEYVVESMQEDLDKDNLFDEEDLHNRVTEEIKSIMTYDSDCKECVEDLNFDVFSDDNMFAIQPQGWHDAGTIALEELWINNTDVDEMLDKINFG